MKSILLATLISITTINCIAQYLGTKRTIALRLESYGCGDDYCDFELRDEEKGTIYNFFNIDDNTHDYGTFKEIQDEYYSSGETGNFKLILQVYIAVVEYRFTDEYKESGEGMEKTGKKIKKWMINSLRKFMPKSVTIEGVISTSLFDWEGTSAGSGNIIVTISDKKTYTCRIGFVHYEPNSNENERIDEFTKITWPSGEKNQKYGSLQKGMRIKLYGKTIPNGMIYTSKIVVEN